uniref:Uncharacterized protein n=1 Tax=Arundo donax TaxID=35708 RepID=A0A0A9FQG5_ARUDO
MLCHRVEHLRYPGMKYHCRLDYWNQILLHLLYLKRRAHYHQ